MNAQQSPAVQDFYPDDFAHCFGCGRLNPHGHRIRTRWDGDETVTRFVPNEHQIAVPGFVYGGLIASLLDCHAMAAASAARLRQDGQSIGETPSPRYVTAMLQVDFRRPTPIGQELEIRARIDEIGARKVRVSARVVAGGEVTATATVVAVPMPESMRHVV